MFLTSLRNPFLKRLPSILSRSPLFSSFPSIFIPKSTHNQTTFSTSLSTYTDASTGTSSYSSVRILCPKNVADTLSEALLCFGASYASMDESEERADTDEICISSMFAEHHDVGTCISCAADSVGLKWMPSYEIVMDDQCDWVKKSQESFCPVEVAEELWIVPEWTDPPDSEAINIILNPGFAFGTGEHPTTMLCLLLLRSLIKGGELFLDYGTGSGVLAIAALKLGAASSVGLDIDPQAITSAYKNAALNNIGTDKMQVYLVPSKISSSTDGRRCATVDTAESLQDPKAFAEKYDIVIANILLNPLLQLADCIVSYAKPGATVAVSGILSEQLPKIKELYSQFLEGMSVSEMDGWACLSGKKRRY